MAAAFQAQQYRDINNSGFHRGVVSVTGTKIVNLGIGHNNFTVNDLMVKSSLAADINAASALSWDYHPTIKGAFVISAWKVTTPGASGDPTLIAATAAVNISFVAVAGSSVIPG